MRNLATPLELHDPTTHKPIHRSRFSNSLVPLTFHPFDFHFSSQPLLKASVTYLARLITKTSCRLWNSCSPRMTANNSMRLMVVSLKCFTTSLVVVPCTITDTATPGPVQPEQYPLA